MSYSKLRVYYQGDGSNTWNISGTTSQLEKKITITLPVQVKKYGDEYGYDKIVITSYSDHLVLKGSNGQTLFDRDVNGEDNNEYITKITRYEWIGDNYVEPKPLNKYSKIKVYHNWQGDGRTLTLPLSKECIEYGDRYGYDTITVSKTGWEFAMSNKEGGIMIYKSFQDYDVNSGVGKVIKIEWLNAQIESEIKKLKNQFTKVRVNHGANSKMTVTLPKKLTEFGDRYGYDKITFARKGATFYLYDPDGFILLRKDCWETGLGEIKSMEWLNDKAQAVPFKPAPAPFEVPVEEPTSEPAPAPVVEEISTKVEMDEERERLAKEAEEKAQKEAEKARLEAERVAAEKAQKEAEERARLLKEYEERKARSLKEREERERKETEENERKKKEEEERRVRSLKEREERERKKEAEERERLLRAAEKAKAEAEKARIEALENTGFSSTNMFWVTYGLTFVLFLGIYIWYGIDDYWDFWEWFLWFYVALIAGGIAGAVGGGISKVAYRMNAEMKPTAFLVIFYLNVLIALGVCIWYGIDEYWDFWEWALGYFLAVLSGTIAGAVCGFIAKIAYKIKYRNQ